MSVGLLLAVELRSSSVARDTHNDPTSGLGYVNVLTVRETTPRGCGELRIETVGNYGRLWEPTTSDWS
jgi:hypothetical protein